MGFSAAWSLFRLDAQYVFSHRHINIADSSNLLIVHRHMIWRLPWRMVCSRSHGHVNPVRLSCARTLSPSPSRPKTPRMSGQPRALVDAIRLVLCSCYFLYASCDMPLYALHEPRRECSGPTTVHKQSTKCSQGATFAASRCAERCMCQVRTSRRRRVRKDSLTRVTRLLPEVRRDKIVL